MRAGHCFKTLKVNDIVVMKCTDDECEWEGVVKEDSFGRLYIEHSGWAAYYPTLSDEIIEIRRK